MAKKTYEMWLDDQTYVVVNFEVGQGRVVGFVVRLMLATAMGVVSIARYDTAHGTPHRDLNNRKGQVVSKDWLFDLDLNSAMTCAIADFKGNYDSAQINRGRFARINRSAG